MITLAEWLDLVDNGITIPLSTMDNITNSQNNTLLQGKVPEGEHGRIRFNTPALQLDWFAPWEPLIRPTLATCRF
jgi:hypothetical protein